MARPTYTDLYLSFTAGTNTNPSITQINNVITSLIKQAFSHARIDYTEEDDDIIDSVSVLESIKVDASDKINKWINYITNRNKQGSEMPSMLLSDQTKETIEKELLKENGIIENVDTYNSNIL